MAGALPELPDVWASVGHEGLPGALVRAFDDQDWKSVRRELSTLMDGAITDGVYGRKLLQLVLQLPAKTDSIFDRYRAAAMLDHGDWDGLRGPPSDDSIEHLEVRGVREILTAPVEHSTVPPYGKELHQRRLFEVYEYQLRRSMRAYRHWAQRIANELPDSLWQRDDIAIGRHLRYRRLHDITVLAIGESHAGRLDVAYALASEAQRLGDEAEPLRFMAVDLANLVRLALGDDIDFELTVPARIADPCGPSPLGAAEMVSHLVAFLPLRRDGAVSWAARLAENIAARLASPRLELQGQSWRVASDLLSGSTSQRTELAGLIARSRRATPGLRALPLYLQGMANRRYDSFSEAERLANASGNLWLQISCLCWMVAMDPRAGTARRLRRLLDSTGWRRPSLVPSEVCADAALGLTSLGERSEAIIDLAISAGRNNVTTEIASAYLADSTVSPALQQSAANALARIDTRHAREKLSRLAQRRDDVGRVAAAAAQRPPGGLTDREVEVLSLAGQGMTNKQIGEKLFLSPHTIARHLANARAKLGASNRAEAAVLLRRPSEAGLRGPGEGT